MWIVIKGEIKLNWIIDGIVISSSMELLMNKGIVI